MAIRPRGIGAELRTKDTALSHGSDGLMNFQRGEKDHGRWLAEVPPAEKHPGRQNSRESERERDHRAPPMAWLITGPFHPNSLSTLSLLDGNCLWPFSLTRSKPLANRSRLASLRLRWLQAKLKGSAFGLSRLVVAFTVATVGGLRQMRGMVFIE